MSLSTLDKINTYIIYIYFSKCIKTLFGRFDEIYSFFSTTVCFFICVPQSSGQFKNLLSVLFKIDEKSSKCLGCI